MSRTPTSSGCDHSHNDRNWKEDHERLRRRILERNIQQTPISVTDCLDDDSDSDSSETSSSSSTTTSKSTTCDTSSQFSSNSYSTATMVETSSSSTSESSESSEVTSNTRSGRNARTTRSVSRVRFPGGVTARTINIANAHLSMTQSQLFKKPHGPKPVHKKWKKGKVYSESSSSSSSSDEDEGLDWLTGSYSDSTTDGSSTVHAHSHKKSKSKSKKAKWPCFDFKSSSSDESEGWLCWHRDWSKTHSRSDHKQFEWLYCPPDPCHKKKSKCPPNTCGKSKGSICVNRTAFVDPNFGGPFAQLENEARPFINIQAALNAIQSQHPNRDSNNVWQVVIRPGVYTGQALSIPGFIDLVGSGHTTIVRQELNVGAGATLIRDLRLELTLAIVVGGTTELKMENLTILRTGTGASRVFRLVGTGAQLHLKKLKVEASSDTQIDFITNNGSNPLVKIWKVVAKLHCQLTPHVFIDESLVQSPALLIFRDSFFKLEWTTPSLTPASDSGAYVLKSLQARLVVNDVGHSVILNNVSATVSWAYLINEAIPGGKHLLRNSTFNFQGFTSDRIVPVFTTAPQEAHLEDVGTTGLTSYDPPLITQPSVPASIAPAIQMNSVGSLALTGGLRAGWRIVNDPIGNTDRIQPNDFLIVCENTIALVLIVPEPAQNPGMILKIVSTDESVEVQNPDASTLALLFTGFGVTLACTDTTWYITSIV